jgi:hypothetical protein
MDFEFGGSALPFAALDRSRGGDGCCCDPCVCCERVGSLTVLCEAPRQQGIRRRLWCVVGPYWAVMVCVTTPLIAGPCAGALYYMAPRVPVPLTVSFAVAALFVLTALWLTACSDPGLVVRQHTNPAEDTPQRAEWAWEDRTKTFRPLSARFADDCGVLVEGYDHTCPWTGTAIGKGNLRYFYAFTFSLLPLVIFMVGCLLVAVSNDGGTP